MAPLLQRWGGVENTLRTRRFQRRLAKDPIAGKELLLHHLIMNIVDILNLCYLLADYERIFQEKSRRMTIKNVLGNGGRICGGCNNMQAWVRIDQRA